MASENRTEVIGADDKEYQKETVTKETEVNSVNAKEDQKPETKQRAKGVPVVDADGHTLMLQHDPDLKGYKYLGVVFDPEATKNIPNFKLREDDILISSFPKAGCHWLWDIVRMLQAGHLILDAARKETCMMEKGPQEDIDKVPSPRVLNNHEHFEGQPKDIFKNKNKIILMYRNLKDALNSKWHLRKVNYKGTFEQYIRRQLDGLCPFGNPLDYLQSWDKGIRENPNLPVFVCSFEELKKDPIPVLKSMAEFLGVERKDEDFLKTIIEETDIDKMRERKVIPQDVAKGVIVSRMYRKGVIGDWKNVFTVAQDEWFSKLVDEKLKGTVFKMVYE